MRATNGDPIVHVERVTQDTQDTWSTSVRSGSSDPQVRTLEWLADAVTSGRVDSTIITQDADFLWLNYSDNGVLAPGDLGRTFRVNAIRFTAERWTTERLIASWQHLLSRSERGEMAPGVNASLSGSSVADSTLIVADFMTELQHAIGTVKDGESVWSIVPDFLCSSDSDLRPQAGKFAYFESQGTQPGWLQANVGSRSSC